MYIIIKTYLRVPNLHAGNNTSTKKKKKKRNLFLIKITIFIKFSKLKLSV